MWTQWIQLTTTWVRQVSRTGRIIIPRPTMSSVGTRERTSTCAIISVSLSVSSHSRAQSDRTGRLVLTFAPACGFHIPYIPSKLDLPDRDALPVWACRVELSSVMTSFSTVERPTVDTKEKKAFYKVKWVKEIEEARTIEREREEEEERKRKKGWEGWRGYQWHWWMQLHSFNEMRDEGKIMVKIYTVAYFHQISRHHCLLYSFHQ